MHARNRFAVVVSTLIMVLASQKSAWANVYASSVKLSSPGSNPTITSCTAITVTYILNENADSSPGVTIKVKKASDNSAIRTVTFTNPEAQNMTRRGTHTFTWDKKKDDTTPAADDTYYFEVTADDDGYGAWTEITGGNTPQNNFFVPTGVDVNKNPASQNFGRVYVVEGTGGTTGAGRPLTGQDGMFLLNADLTDAVGQGNTARKGGITYGAANSPYRTFVGPDDLVYQTDWSDSLSALRVNDPDWSGTASEVLDNTGRLGTGLAANHGSLPCCVVEGLGAGRIVYTMDEDYPSAPAAGSINHYDIGNGALPYTAAPAVLYNDTTPNNMANGNYKLTHASDGTWWMTQNRAGSTSDTLTSVMQVSSDGSTVLFKSVPDLAANSLADPFTRALAIAWDPRNDWLAVATTQRSAPTGNALLKIVDDDTKTVLATINVPGDSTSSTSGNKDSAFDAAGNLYVVNNVGERLRVYSPPNNSNSFVTTSGNFTLNGVGTGGPTINSGPSPSAQSVCLNANANFTVSASGLGTLNYQWIKNGNILSNGGHYSNVTTATLTITGVDSNDVGSYQVSVCDLNGVTLSGTATLGIYAVPSITTNPFSNAKHGGESASFVAAGTSNNIADLTVAYQWYKAPSTALSDIGGKISGSTSLAGTLTISNLVSADAGGYFLRVTDACGRSSDSAIAQLVVLGQVCHDPFADADGSGVTDLSDFGAFQACYSGPTGAGFDAAVCGCFDRNGDGDVDDGDDGGGDVSDFAAYQACAGAAGSHPLPADPNCDGSQILFTDDFDADHTANWTVLKPTGTNANDAGNIAEFFYNYGSTASPGGVAIPSAPNSTGGSTRGLRLRANIASVPVTNLTGLTASPTGLSITGDFTMRFDLWTNFNGNPTDGVLTGATGSTQVTEFGWGTAGAGPQLVGGSNFNGIPAIDSIFFACTGDGQNAADYRAYAPNQQTSYQDGVTNPDGSYIYAAGAAAGGFGDRNAKHPYHAGFFGGAVENNSPPAGQLANFPNQFGTTNIGATGFRWRDVMVVKSGNFLVWFIDNHLIAVVQINQIGTLGGGNIVLGQCDVNATSVSPTNCPAGPACEQELTFSIFDNVRVTR